MKQSKNIDYRQARSGKWIVFEKLPPFEPNGVGYRTGHQYARFDTEPEAIEYMAELKADLDRKEAEIERMLRQPLPATPAQVDPFDHPAFWFIDVDDRKEAVEIAAIREMLTPEQLAEPMCHREWANTEIIVYDGYESPYQFGRLLRQLMKNDSAVIFRYNPRGIYFAMATASRRVAYYDPAKRDHIPEYIVDGEIDWFKAVDSIAVPDDLITQADAARLAGVSTQAIHNATRNGRLVGYPNPNPEYERQGVTLVSQAAVENIEWRKNDKQRKG